MNRNKKNPAWKRLLLVSALLVAVGGGIYWYIATDKFADTADRKAAYTVNAVPFIKEFELNDSAANKKYTDKIIVVAGIVSEVEAADTTMNIKFIDSTSGSYIIFAFQEQHLDDTKNIKPGDAISIKGSCSGSVYSSLRKTTFISFKRSALNK